MRMFVAAMLAILVPAAQAQHKDGEAAIHRPAELKWQDGPPSLPQGAMIAILEGDPSKDGPFVFRVKLPDGYRIPPHVHKSSERLTVISGTFCLGMGNKFDAKNCQVLPAGTYGQWPPDMKHFAWARGETIVQIHGAGPWTITYLDPRDDPRKKKGE